MTIRVLVVDDSAFARKVLREALGQAPDIEVAGYAHDGLDALEKIAELNPDVVTLDLMMPELDGLGVLRALTLGQRARVVLVSISDAESALVVEALQLGAFDLVRKPTALATDRLYDISTPLLEVVRLAGRVAASNRSPIADTGPVKMPTAKRELVVIGTSTGGPAALTTLARGLVAAFPVPIVCALHIPAGYTEALAARLDQLSALHVVEASDELALTPGMMVIARGGEHAVVERRGADLVVRVRGAPTNTLHKPSVDVLFHSAVEACGGNVVAAVLTGMGEDGLLGARAVHAAGGVVLVESERSAVVFGMPRVVREAGIADGTVRIEKLADELLHVVGAVPTAAAAL